MTSLKNTLDNGMQELRTLRDEIRVRLNLAGKEARDRWEQHFEPWIERLELQIKNATDATMESLREAVDRARTSFHEYRAQLTQGSPRGASSGGAGEDPGAQARTGREADEGGASSGGEPDFSRVPPDKR